MFYRATLHKTSETYKNRYVRVAHLAQLVVAALYWEHRNLEMSVNNQIWSKYVAHISHSCDTAAIPLQEALTHLKPLCKMIFLLCCKGIAYFTHKTTPIKIRMSLFWQAVRSKVPSPAYVAYAV